MPLTPPQRKSADPKPESKQAENAPSSSQVLPRPTASKAQLAQVARSSSNKLAPAETQPVDEQFLRDLMSANLADVESQLELQLEGRTAVDHIPDGLSTLSQYLLYIDSNCWITLFRWLPGKLYDPMQLELLWFANISALLLLSRILRDSDALSFC